MPLRNWCLLLPLCFVAPYGCGLLESDEEQGPGLASPSARGESGRVENPVTDAERGAALARGKRTYRAACAPCHGRRGDGRGRAAYALDPKPLGFRQGVFKWRSTETGALPLDSDIFRTITRGVPGTMMPPWEDLLSERERWELVEYITSLSPRFEEEGVEDDQILEIPLAVPVSNDTIVRGLDLYDTNKCWECHGEDGTGYGPAVDAQEAKEENFVRPFDFTTGNYRGGSADEDIYRTMFTGINGTTMPSYADAIPEQDRWPLIHFLRSLQRSPTLLERIILEVP